LLPPNREPVSQLIDGPKIRAQVSIVFGSDTWWRSWLYGDAVFTEEDVENTWRFIVKKMPHILRAL
jgi:hypothetical protein